MNTAVLAEYQCVGCPDQRGPIGDDIRQMQDRLFVRNGDIATHEIARPEPFDKAGEVGRCHVHGFVSPRNFMLFDPAAMNQGRAGMDDRMADDEGAFHVNLSKMSGACWRNAASNGSSGRPSMVK